MVKKKKIIERVLDIDQQVMEICLCRFWFLEEEMKKEEEQEDELLLIKIK